MPETPGPQQPFIPQQKQAPAVEQTPPSPEQLEALWEETPATDFSALRDGLAAVLKVGGLPTDTDII
jgi:hypothetical protein